MACKDCEGEVMGQTHNGEDVCRDCYRERRHRDLEEMLDATEPPAWNKK